MINVSLSPIILVSFIIAGSSVVILIGELLMPAPKSIESAPGSLFATHMASPREMTPPTPGKSANTTVPHAPASMASDVVSTVILIAFANGILLIMLYGIIVVTVSHIATADDASLRNLVFCIFIICLFCIFKL